MRLLLRPGLSLLASTYLSSRLVAGSPWKEDRSHDLLGRFHFECDNEKRTLRLLHEGKKSQKSKKGSKKGYDDVNDNETGAWVYPKSFLKTGFDYQTGANLDLPISTAEALERSWVFDEETCRWMNMEEAPRFRLGFLDGSLFSVRVLARPALITDPKFFTPTGQEYFFTDGYGNFGVSDRSGIEYPLHVDDAIEQGWHEGGCFPPMGGSHFFQLPFEESSSNFPIYDMYGTGEMVAMVAGFQYHFDVATEGFDSVRAISLDTVCSFSFCDVEGCSEFAQDVTNGSNDDAFAVSNIHFFWDFDPTSDPADWNVCGTVPFTACTVLPGCNTCCPNQGDTQRECTVPWSPSGV